MKPSDELKQLEQDLKTLDWFYEFSDDHRVWSTGRRQLTSVVGRLSKLSYTESESLWNKYASHKYRDSLRDLIDLQERRKV